MPIQKFRSVEDMPRPGAQDNLSSEEVRSRIERLWSRTFRISPRVYPKGLFRFKSIEEAQEARERVTATNVDRLARERESRSKEE